MLNKNILITALQAAYGLNKKQAAALAAKLDTAQKEAIIAGYINDAKKAFNND